MGELWTEHLLEQVLAAPGAKTEAADDDHFGSVQEPVQPGTGQEWVLKAITPPSMNAFDALIEQARQQAAESGLDSAELANATKKAQAKK